MIFLAAVYAVGFVIGLSRVVYAIHDLTTQRRYMGGLWVAVTGFHVGLILTGLVLMGWCVALAHMLT